MEEVFLKCGVITRTKPRFISFAFLCRVGEEIDGTLREKLQQKSNYGSVNDSGSHPGMIDSMS
jgi:hypothetical protein